ncbi:MAG: 50S ribosomal protein L11 methyltransferase [Desulfarculaceae bacterium]|nr:50S ribosomal protein L11 methyltransferase [Desulfarculaceae bacterium]
MKWTQVKAVYGADNPELAEELVSDLFFSHNVKGVVCSMPEPETDPVPPACGYVTGYLPRTREGDETVRAILSGTGRLEKLGIKVNFTCCTIDEEDWSESWKEHFHVTRITDTLVVKPEWRTHPAGEEEIVIEIDPGMAFGTGTHPTTRLCMKMLEVHLQSGNRVLDVGTGSGILLITAAKLGASGLYGIDNDPLAVSTAGENLVKNKIEPESFHLSHNTIQDIPPEKFDIILANILAGVIVEILPEIRTRLKPDGTAILSGIIEEKKETVLSCLEKNGLHAVSIEQEEEWVAIAAAHS